MLTPGARDALGRQDAVQLIAKLHDVQGRLEDLKRRRRELAHRTSRAAPAPAKCRVGHSPGPAPNRAVGVTHGSGRLEVLPTVIVFHPLAALTTADPITSEDGCAPRR